MLEKILEIKQKIINNQELDLDYLLADSLAYDGEFPNYVIENPAIRLEYMEKNKLQDFFKEEIGYLEEIDSKIPNVWSKNLRALLFINDIVTKEWRNMFWISAEPIELNIDTTNESDLYILKTLWKLFFLIVNKKPFLRFNFSRAIILVNFILQKLKYPCIYFSFKDRKRILREVDHYIDFDKEFLLSLFSSINKELYENFYKDQIISVEEKKLELWKKDIYIRPGYWWRWKDRRKYTIKDNLSNNKQIW